MIEESEPFALTGVVVVEVLQGLTKDSGPIERFLAECDMLEPAGFETYRGRSEEHTSELQSLAYLVCRLLLEKKKNQMRECEITELLSAVCVYLEQVGA